MPRRFTRRRFARRRAPVRKRIFRRRRGARTTKMTRGPATISDRIIVRMKYVAFETMTTSTASDHLFNLNSIFDPDRTGIGHQPLGHDQWANFYSKYRVFATKIRVSAMRTDNTILGGVFGFFPSNNTSAATTVNVFQEQPRARWKGIAQGAGMGKVNLRANYSLPKVIGQTSAQYRSGDTQYPGVFGASPNELIILHVVGASIDQITQISFHYSIEIDYFVELFDRLQLGQS